jgi:hypothetical protein
MIVQGLIKESSPLVNRIGFGSFDRTVLVGAKKPGVAQRRISSAGARDNVVKVNWVSAVSRKVAWLACAVAF